ncbi:MAG TPA: hypothetical protein VGR82_03355 [Methylomirabilota bacterium]|jgi:hypothetical protein|nr:hypothetical protein [Methylomirabilota bacterium]
MVSNPWKLATIGMALIGTTALGSGLTTAWMLRPTTDAQAQTIQTQPTRPAAQYAAVSTPAQPVRAVSRSAVAAPITRASATAPADCATGGDRALRIAKPGAVGALLGAGLGAAGGAIANGGKAAGKGAIIGGIAGAALGTGYGAYKTKNECGTIFGNTFSASPATHAGVIPALQSAGGERIQVVSAR